MPRVYSPRFEIVRTWGDVPEAARHLIACRWFFRIRASNGRILAHSESYWRKSDCMKAIRAVKRARDVRVIDNG